MATRQHDGAAAIDCSKITTLVFDVDDTLYDVGTGFTAHRNGTGATSFMMSRLGFADEASAKAVRDEYFARYHSTAKGLAVAEEEGRFPGTRAPQEGKRLFDAGDLSEWWATRLDFSLLGGPDPGLVSALEACPLKLVAFSNGPRKYVLRVLKELGLDGVFPPASVYAVDDVLPLCKPEPGAFREVLKRIGCADTPEECVMVEDSTKNVRAAAEIGMRTVLVVGKGRAGGGISDGGRAEAAEATKAGDAPDAEDPAVDVCVGTVLEMRDVLPGLWERK